MQTTEIRAHLVEIVTKGSARGDGATYTPAEAEAALDRMIASDDAADWNDIRVGREQMQQVIVGYLR